MNVLIYLCFVFSSVFTQSVLNVSDHKKSEILSRRKRFIVFPEGSSFQLVFCLTYPTIFKIDDIFLWGVTAALAFELPQDPYSPFNHKADPLHRREDTKMIYYTSEEGKIIYKRPYTKKLIVNPAFAKRSVDASEQGDIIKGIRMARKQMHSENKREIAKFGDHRSTDFHRSGRASLYRKIEAMLQGLGTDGKQCMLKTLCLVGKTEHHPQGTFFQEILRATFTLPQSELEDNSLEEYDAAFSATATCEELYDCEEGLTDPMPSRS